MATGADSSAPFGWRGTISPADAGVEPFTECMAPGIELSVNDRVLQVAYHKAEDEAQALALATAFVKAWSFRHDKAISVDLNQSWQVNADGHKHFAVHLHAVLTAGASVIATGTVVDPSGAVVEQPNYDVQLAVKAESDPALARALDFYTHEVVDDDRPLYGVYKAIEELCAHLGGDGRAKLGGLAGRDKKYVEDLMQTTQVQRHARTRAPRVERSRMLCKST